MFRTRLKSMMHRPSATDCDLHHEASRADEQF